ncbi:MAG: universal stress protein [Thermodesulfovibrionales bacterium]|nr:universal stress protein [Thermodesulfovibrionales bacterium]
MNILVPVDGSKYSMDAVKAALDFAKTKKAEIHLMTVTPFLAGLDLELSAKEADSVNVSMKRRGEEVLEKAAAMFQAEGVSVKTILMSSGSPANEILEVAEKKKMDLIVIGSKGLGGKATRFFMGSVASKVVGHALCSVLVVKKV